MMIILTVTRLFRPNMDKPLGQNLSINFKCLTCMYQCGKVDLGQNVSINFKP